MRTSADPAALASQDNGGPVAVLANDPLQPTASYAFPPRHVELSSVAGLTWRSVASPCADLEATGIALDGQLRPLVVCQGEPGGGTARKTLYRATTPEASAWTKLAPPPEMGTQFEMSIASDGTGVMWGPRSPLLTTADGGAHWTADPPVADGNARIVLGGSALGGDRAVVLVWDPDRQGTELQLVTWHGLAAQTTMAFFPIP
jgi:hypothetical protein